MFLCIALIVFHEHHHESVRSTEQIKLSTQFQLNGLSKQYDVVSELVENFIQVLTTLERYGIEHSDPENPNKKNQQRTEQAFHQLSQTADKTTNFVYRLMPLDKGLAKAINNLVELMHKTVINLGTRTDQLRTLPRVKKEIYEKNQLILDEVHRVARQVVENEFDHTRK